MPFVKNNTPSIWTGPKRMEKPDDPTSDSFFKPIHAPKGVPGETVEWPQWYLDALLEGRAPYEALSFDLDRGPRHRTITELAEPTIRARFEDGRLQRLSAKTMPKSVPDEGGRGAPAVRRIGGRTGPNVVSMMSEENARAAALRTS